MRTLEQDFDEIVKERQRLKTIRAHIEANSVEVHRANTKRMSDGDLESLLLKITNNNALALKALGELEVRRD